MIEGEIQGVEPSRNFQVHDDHCHFTVHGMQCRIRRVFDMTGDPTMPPGKVYGFDLEAPSGLTLWIAASDRHLATYADLVAAWAAFFDGEDERPHPRTGANL